MTARPSNCLTQLVPPSLLARMTPSWPTAQPFLSLTKYTAVRSELTGTADCFQLCPPSADTTMWPRGPTATSRSPARATDCSSRRDASSESCAGRSSTSTPPFGRAPSLAAESAAWAGSSVAAKAAISSKARGFIASPSRVSLPTEAKISPREANIRNVAFYPPPPSVWYLLQPAEPCCGPLARTQDCDGSSPAPSQRLMQMASAEVRRRGSQSGLNSSDGAFGPIAIAVFSL